MQKNIWLTVLAVLLLAVTGVLIYQYTGSDNEKANPPQEDTEENTENAPNVEQQKNAHGNDHFSVQHMDYPGEVSPEFSAEELVKSPSTNWITNGGNIYNDRYSTLDQRSEEHRIGKEKRTQNGSG